MIEKDRLIHEFIELVRVDSETRNEQEISKLLKHKFSELGLQVREDEAAATTGHGAGNLYAVLEASEGAEHIPNIFFTCHMDTVAPGKGIRPQIDDDGFIRSDGTTILGSDDKAGIAVILEALKVICEQQIYHGRIQIIITVGEELGLVGARAANPEWIEAEFGFALDSSGNVGKMVVAAPTQAKIYVKLWGKSAHAGINPEDGISAIQMAGKAVSRMTLGRIDHETTANIGSFKGGASGVTNIVCESAELEAEVRSLDNAKLEKQIQSMEQAFIETAEEYGGRVDFKADVIYPAYSFTESDPMVQMAIRAMQKADRKAELIQSGGGSDANIFNGMGIPTLNLAVGYEQIHTKNEQIAISEMVALSEIVVNLIAEAANG